MAYIQGDFLNNISSKPNHKQGFTLVEVMVAIAVVAILSAIALPSLNNFMVQMRVDNEVTELQRLLLTARNMAINTGKNTTVCPLYSGNCTNNWQNEISVFTNDTNAPGESESFAANDELVKIKEAIKSNDKLEFDFNFVIYSPSGQLISSDGTFSYCPKDKADESRGITLSLSGRSYLSSDTNNDGKDEDRSGNEIVCS